MTNQIRPPHLPDFERPPLEQVALGVTFDELKLLKSFHIGMLAGSFAEFPVIEEQPKVPTTFETFGSSFQPPNIAFQFLTEAPLARYCFCDEKHEHLLQLQSDRLTRNWIRQQGGIYPRYEFLRESFERDFERVKKFAFDKNIGPLNLIQFEVSYVNAIAVENSEITSQVLSKVFCFWSNSFNGPGDRPIENADIKFTQVLTKNQKPYARLFIAAQPAVRNIDRSHFLHLTITVRGKPDGASIKDSLKSFDEARDCIVTSFDAITRPEMHKLWGKKS